MIPCVNFAFLTPGGVLLRHAEAQRSLAPSM